MVTNNQAKDQTGLIVKPVAEGEVACRLVEEYHQGAPGYDKIDKYYKGLTDVLSAHKSASVSAAATWAVLFLLYIGGLEKAEILGVEPKGDALKVVGLIASVFTFLLVNLQAQKLSLFQSYFQVLYRDASAPEKQHLLFRYPLAFDSILFLRENVGLPTGLVRNLPKLRTAAFGVFGGLIFVVYMVAFYWLIIAVAIDVVRSPGSLGSFWNWIFVIVSLFALIATLVIASHRHVTKKYAVDEPPEA